MRTTTVRDTIIDTLRAADRPLTQSEIAGRTYMVPSSVRRECQILRRRGIIENAYDDSGSPLLRLVPITLTDAVSLD